MGLLDRAIRKLPRQYQGLAGQIAQQVQEHQRTQGQGGSTPGTSHQGGPATHQPPANRPAPSQSSGHQPGHQPSHQPGAVRSAGSLSADEQAVARYRYLLQTAPPHELEQAHTEAFTRLTPQQRQLVLTEVSQGLPEQERPTSAEPQALARAATRAEVRQPGFLAKAFAGKSLGRTGAATLGVAAGATVLGTMGALVVGTAVGGALLENVDLGEIAGLADLGDLGALGDLGGLGDVGGAAEEMVGGVTGEVGALGEEVTQLGDGFGGLGDALGDFKLPWD